MVVRGKIVNLVGQHLADQLCNCFDIQDIHQPLRHVAVNAITVNTNDSVSPRCQFAAEIVAILPIGSNYDCAALHTREVFRLLKLELAHEQYCAIRGPIETGIISLWPWSNPDRHASSRNGAHGSNDRHKSMVVESRA